MRLASLVVIGVCVVAVGSSAGQQPPAAAADVPWGPAPGGKLPFLRMVLPNDLSIDIPGRNGQDWHAYAGAGNVVVLAIERKKGEAALWIERVPLGSTMIEGIEDQYLLAEAAADLQRKEPSATDARHAVVTRDNHRLVYSTYVRKGVLPTAERVFQYVILTPGLSYRVVCAIDAAVADRYRPICGHMARSFATTLPAASAPAAPQ